MILCSTLSAEVLFLRNGEIVIGDFVSADSGTITLRSMGTERTVSSTDVLRTEKGLMDIGEITVQVVLKDGTSIRGKLTDFDEEVGLFIDIGFGTLALPIAAIARIEDPGRIAVYQGTKMSLGLSGGISTPLDSDYGLSGGGGVLAEIKTGLARGLYAGFSLGGEYLAYAADSNVKIVNADFQIYALYKLLALGEVFPALELLTPYASLGIGGTLVTLLDSRVDAPVDQRGILSFSTALAFGLEWKLPANISLRTGGELDGILQTSGLFLIPKARLALLYGF